MKYISILLIILSFVSCKEEKLKDHVSFSGHFSNLKEKDSIIRVNAPGYSKLISIDKEGNFKDTLRIKNPDFYTMSLDYKTRFSTYLNIGDELVIEGDLKDLNNTLSFKGRGEDTNNYLLTRVKEVGVFTQDLKNYYALDTTEFNKEVNKFKSKFDELLNNKNIDTAVVSKERFGLNGYLKRIKNQYAKKHAMTVTFAKGKISPKFTDYENFKGGKVSLADLKGKYVYIDVWATWCRPCLGEIPSLKELEKEYEGKNIEFVSISTDKIEKHEAWKNMIIEKGMSGMQLFAGNDKSFMKEYQINSIPRFIFIDPNGNIVSADAPRPSQKEALNKLFKEVGL